MVERDLIGELETIEIDSEVMERLKLPSTEWRLQRVWPKGQDRLGLEYASDGGERIVGQWHAQENELERIARQTARPHSTAVTALVSTERDRILLQLGGADRRLPGLAPLLKRPGARLMVHRPEKRGVVHLPEEGLYARALPVQHIEKRLLQACSIGNPSKETFRVASLVRVDSKLGVMYWEELRGASLLSLLGTKEQDAACEATGRALAALHSVSGPSPARHVPRHDPRDEIAVLHQWVERVGIFRPALAVRLRPLIEPIASELGERPQSPTGLLHRDLYDKQVIWSDGRIGLIDLDTLSAGEVALDLANACVHFELRAIHGLSSEAQAASAREALLRGYAPSAEIERRLAVYAAATRLRLACVYSLRPPQMACADVLRERILR